MKTRIALLLMVICVSAFPVAAQTAFGLKAGMNFTTLDIDDPDVSYESRTGYHAGIFMRARFDRVGIQPELLLFTQAGDIETSIFGTAKETFTYLSIPVMLKFYPVAGLNVQVGPQFGFLLDGEREYDTFLGSGSEDITDHYKKSDVSVAVGAGYDFDFGLGLDLRYNIGVKDINDAVDGEEARSRIFVVSLGWNFLR